MMKTNAKTFKNKIHAEKRGRILTFLSIFVMFLIAASIIMLITSNGLRTFFINKADIAQFFMGEMWKPGTMDEWGKPIAGALPMIFGSFSVTILAAVLSAPLAIGAAVFMTEISPVIGKRVMQPAIELLVGIPSVVYGFIGLTLVVPFLREFLSGSGFGIAAGTIVLSIMILPTVTSLCADAIKTVPKEVREASLALGCTRWQTISQVILKASVPGLLTAVVFGMARAFGEALAVQMVIGNAMIIPESLVEPASTLTSILTMGMGYTVMGSAENNALWSLALVLLLMSFVFIAIVRLLGKRRVYK